MDYKKKYDSLIFKRQKYPAASKYVEYHHIIPKSLGGADNITNLVKLTAREHYVAHLLLTYIYPENSKLHYALWMMMNCMSETNAGRRRTKPTSIFYERARINASKLTSNHMKIAQKGKSNSQYGTQWVCNVNLRVNKKISNISSVPVGWIRGRNKWKTHKGNMIWLTNSELKLNKKIHKYKGNYNLLLKAGWKLGYKKYTLETKKNHVSKQKYAKYFKEFANGEWESLSQYCKDIGYEYTSTNLGAQWKKYIAGYADIAKQRTKLTSNKCKNLLNNL